MTKQISLKERIDKTTQFDMQLKRLLKDNKLIEIVHRMNSFYAFHPDAKDILTIMQHYSESLSVIKELETIISIQESFIKSFVVVSETKGNGLPDKSFLRAMSILGRDVLEKTEQFLNGENNA